MSRLIDADSLKSLYDPSNYEGNKPDENWDHITRTFDEIRADIDEEPTVDVVPVVHGHWIYCKGSNGKDYRKCSVCLHTQEITGVLNYCPICGAMADEVTE